MSRILGVLTFLLLLPVACGDVAEPQPEPSEPTATLAEALSDDPCALVRCASGTHCVANGHEATCQTDVFCGGIAAFECPGAGACADDPTDDCDPENGGADCGGRCECSGALVLCAPGTTFDDSPEVCACTPLEENPCNLAECAPGYRCEAINGQAECLADVFCGGLANMACPGAGTCADDPTDDCDPESGGADCGGRCECSGALVLCAPGTTFDNSPEVCACEPETSPCAAVLCGPNTTCVARGDQARCVPVRPRPHPRHDRRPWPRRHPRPHR